MEYHGVTGHADLLRDATSKSIVNVNHSEYQKYIARRDAKKRESEKQIILKEILLI